MIGEIATLNAPFRTTPLSTLRTGSDYKFHYYRCRTPAGIVTCSGLLEHRLYDHSEKVICAISWCCRRQHRFPAVPSACEVNYEKIRSLIWLLLVVVVVVSLLVVVVVVAVVSLPILWLLSLLLALLMCWLRSVFKFQVCFCGLDSGNLKFETVRTDRQHICF